MISDHNVVILRLQVHTHGEWGTINRLEVSRDSRVLGIAELLVLQAQWRYSGHFGDANFRIVS